MSIASEINRINNNVTDALAATAEKGATVPEGATSDNLGTLIRSIPTGGSSLPPLRIRLNGTGTSISQGLGDKYTAAELYEIAGTRDIVVETRGLVNSQYLYGYYRYSRGTETVVDFDGWYETQAKRRVPANMQINASGGVTVIKKMFAEGTLVTDPTLNISGSAADSKTVGTKFKEISEQIANMGGGGGVNVTAEVGQTIVVKEVDADGKPTAWEAADHQPRTHWSEFETVTILPETMFELDPEQGAGEFLVDFALEPNKAYTIVYNGVEYADCVGMELVPGELYFGNLGVMDESLATEHPFALISAAGDFDGDGNIDYAMVLGALDGSTSVTLSIEGEEEIVQKIPKKYVPTLEEMRGENSVILSDVTVEPDPLNNYMAILPISSLELGEIYTVTCNGISIRGECVRNGDLLVVGALNHPFIIVSGLTEDGASFVAFVPVDESLRQESEVTLSIDITRVKKISTEYLPKGITSTVVFDVKIATDSSEVEFPYNTIDDVIAAVDSGKHVVLHDRRNLRNTADNLTFVHYMNGYYYFESVEHVILDTRVSVGVRQVVIQDGYPATATYTEGSYSIAT